LKLAFDGRDGSLCDFEQVMQGTVTSYSAVAAPTWTYLIIIHGSVSAGRTGLDSGHAQDKWQDTPAEAHRHSFAWNEVISGPAGFCFEFHL
jgi:hypothetical protein